MDVNVSQMNNYNAVNTLMDTNNSQTNSQNNTIYNSTANEAEKAAVYESSKDDKTTYKPDYDKIQQMLAESDAKVNEFRMLMEKIFNKQGMTYNQSIQQLKYALSEDGTKLNIEVDEATRLKAEADLAEDGYWGVDKTATRIMDFAKALSGGDPSKIETLREAVQKAFGQAEEQWGSKLPEISQKTYDEVMKRFDQWAEESKLDKEAEKSTPVM